MLAAVIREFGSPASVIRVEEQPDPELIGPAEVLLRVRYVPVNPADLLQIGGMYGDSAAAFPLTTGGEGIAEIAAVGPAVQGLRIGDRVLALRRGLEGTWRQKMKRPAAGLVRLPDGDPLQLAMLGINPPTAWHMLKTEVQLEPGDWVIQNAANSAVGRAVVALARRFGLHTVCIVRRPGLAPVLENVGADIVVVEDDDLVATAAATQGRLRLAIDAIGGALAGRMARALSPGGTLLTYGMLSGEACAIDGRDLIFRNITVRGFWLRNWFARAPSEEIVALYARLGELIVDGTLSVPIERVYPLAQIGEALEAAAKGSRCGKILLDMS